MKATNLVFLKNDIHPSAEIKKILLSLLITIVQKFIQFNIQFENCCFWKKRWITEYHNEKIL